jgi:hypothetical protein
MDTVVRTATDRAAEAIEAAESLLADETGTTPELSHALKRALTKTIAAAIQAAAAEERERLKWLR